VAKGWRSNNSMQWTALPAERYVYECNPVGFDAGSGSA
jgi:hypothetical protein